MPISTPIPTYWPPSLFDDEAGEQSPHSWSAYQVKPRCEKRVSQRLNRTSVGYFLPAVEETRRYQRRKVTVQNLLFPGYVFAYGESGEMRSCRYSVPGIVNHLEEADQQSLRGSLLALKEMIDTGAPLTPEQKLEPGVPVEITHGPLTGYRGRVVENKKGLRFVVQLDFIQQGASVAVDGSMVRPV